ncbi:MAG TPA: hypothetical protein VNM47_00560 [Terriglobia bacterium]|nr:hypothetical protein [Terriglobia bacterium]
MKNRTFNAVVIFMMLAAFAALYFQLFIFPNVPLLAQGDQSIYLLNARRMLQGQVIYRDFFHFTLPGTESTYYLLFKLFGVRAWIPNAMLVLMGMGLVGLSVAISRKLMSGPTVFLPAALFLAFPYHSVLDATHHWYSTLAVMAALAITLERRTSGRLCMAGALCGVATWFTQSMGPAVALAFGNFLLWEGRSKHEKSGLVIRKEVSLLAGFVAVVVPFATYFAAKAGIRQFLWCTVTFVLKYYPSDWYNNWRVYMAHRPAIHGWPVVLEWTGWIFIHALLPLIYLAFFIVNRKRARFCTGASARTAQPMLVAMVGSFSLLAVAPASSYRRLCTVSLPAIILLVWYLSSPGNRKKLRRIAIWAVSLCCIVIAPLLVQTNWHAFLNLPTGRTAFTNVNVYDEYRWISQRAGPEDSLFGNQLICFALGLRNPTPLNFVTPSDYTRPEQVQSLVKSLEEDRARYILWYAGLPLSNAQEASGDHLNPLREYLRSHYHLAETFATGDRILERQQ